MITTRDPDPHTCIRYADDGVAWLGIAWDSHLPGPQTPGNETIRKRGRDWSESPGKLPTYYASLYQGGKRCR